MKKSLLALCIVAPLSLGLTGCVIAIDGDKEDHMFNNEHNREFKNRKQIANLPLNTLFNDAKSKLGVADFTESYLVKEQKIQVLYYRTQRLHKDGITSKDETTYLQFVNGILTETGKGDEYKRMMAM